MAGKEVNAEKLKALQLTMDKLDKTYGKGTVMKLGDSAIEEIDVIPTGSLTLDLALGVGGSQKEELLKSTGQNHQVKQHWRFTQLLKFKNKVVLLQS